MVPGRCSKNPALVRLFMIWHLIVCMSVFGFGLFLLYDKMQRLTVIMFLQFSRSHVLAAKLPALRFFSKHFHLNASLEFYYWQELLMKLFTFSNLCIFFNAKAFHVLSIPVCIIILGTCQSDIYQSI